MTAEAKKIHYIVTSDVVDYNPTHIYAASRAEAARAFVQGENRYGYSGDDFDGYDVLVVLDSDIQLFNVTTEEPEPPPQTIIITPNGRGTG